ncbi:hypothetical protein PHLCEN_2v3756 [Hermanssonia centrifuga]|uniref:Uncharacterized protein n=1 Tax=Hermanssonia centrifuga TaxID=98765 RepID=A0A2R6QBI1_9APHY|nr:hypothetical protein PHLCEN_2v3756 [Hermanssonia centrifuga]
MSLATCALTPGTAHTSASIAVINLPEVIYFHDISINVMHPRNHLPQPLPIIVAREQPLPPALRPPSKPAISASHPVYHAMAATHATAPAGPGHLPPNALPHQPHRSSISLNGRLPDEFILGPPPASGSMAGMYLPADYHLSAGSSLYPTHPHAYNDPHQSPNSAMMSAATRDSIDTSPDMLARYRAQAELLNRAGVLPNGALTHNMGAQGTAGLYTADGQPLARYDMSSSQANSWAHPSQSFQSTKDVDGYATGPGRSFPGGGGSAALSAHPPQHGAPFTNMHAIHPGTYADDGVPFPQQHTHHAGHGAHQQHTEELNDDFGSDGGHSVPSSANSSSIHLPMIDPHVRQYASSASPAVGYQQPNMGHRSGRKNEATGEGGFSNAFGLMSLDDPNVLAGLSNDAAPFFSALNGFSHEEGNSVTNPTSPNSSSASLHSTDTSQSNDSHNTSITSNSSQLALSFPTPTPEQFASMKGLLPSAGGRDGFEKFWKQYMRTPLTGPSGGAPLFPLQTPTGPGQQLGSGITGMAAGSMNGGRPSPTRRHSRVASLPSMKTPPLFTANGAIQEMNSFAPQGNFSLSLGPKARERQHHQGQHGHPDQLQGQQGGFSSVRTTLHGDAEDLKSYEQAVLARKAPTTLNLVPKRRGTLPGGSSVPPMGKSMSPPQQPAMPSLSHATNASMMQGMAGHKVGDMNRDRPGSSSSALADAFGSSSSSHSQHQASSESPRESSVGAESDSAASSYRPSFKRLASQTLGPVNSKRALLGPAGWDDDGEEALEDDELDDDDFRYDTRRYHGYGQGQAALRRFSLPAGAGIASGGSTLPPIRTYLQETLSETPVNAYPQ